MVDFAFESFLIWHMGHFVLAAAANGGNDTLEILAVVAIDYPLTLVVLPNGRDSGIELGTFL